VSEQQKLIDFDAAEREEGRLAAMPDKQWERARLILDAAIRDGRDDRGKLVAAWTLKLILLAINSFCRDRGSWCTAATKTIGKRCGDREWARLIPNGKRLSDRTVKSGIQALYNQQPELLDRQDKGKRSERRRILFQYLKPAMSALGQQMGELAPGMGELSALQLEKGTIDDDVMRFLREKGERFFALFGGDRDPETRQRVGQLLMLQRAGDLRPGTLRDIVRRLSAIKRKGRIRNLWSLIYKVALSLGYDLDRLPIEVPDAFCVPPAAAGPPAS
jgi:hypothetical protein